MNNFKLNPGTIFICGIDGETVPIGQNGIPYFDVPIESETDEHQIAELMIDAAQEISFSIKTSYDFRERTNSRGYMEQEGGSVTINLNDKVKVKLTDHGKDIYYHQNDELNEMRKQYGLKPFEPIMPIVDADGYTYFQLWRLMELYGPHIHMASPLPFDVNIVIKSEQEKAGE